MSIQHRQLRTASLRAIISLTVLQACFLFTSPATVAAETKDVIFSTKYSSAFKPTTADFYYNGRAVGSGREAFAEIVGRIRKLPPGTSIVWGPNYRRDGTGSGSEQPCVPRFLYPGLWKELTSSAQRNRLFLSGAYPGPWPRRVPGDRRGDMPSVLDADAAPVSEHFDGLLDWKVSPELTSAELDKA